MFIRTYTPDPLAKSKRLAFPDATHDIDAFYENFNAGNPTAPPSAPPLTPTALYFETQDKAVVLTDLKPEDHHLVLPMLELVAPDIKKMTLHYVEGARRRETHVQPSIIRWMLHPTKHPSIVNDANARFLAAVRYDTVYVVHDTLNGKSLFRFDKDSVHDAYETLMNKSPLYLGADDLDTTVYALADGELVTRDVVIEQVTRYQVLGYKDPVHPD